MDRRTFLGSTAAALAGAAPADVPIIDTHIHLFDPRRPEGVPWPSKENAVLYQPALPERYRRIAVPLGVKGGIVVEASPWLEDNQWVLDLAATDNIVVGTVGNLEPGTPGFRKNLDRFRRNPLFRGIRNGNLWGRNFSDALTKPEFISDLKAMADAGLELDTANPNPALISRIVKLADQVPKLRVVIDHLPRLDPPQDPALRRDYEHDLRELGQRPQIYVKLSGVLRRVDGRVPEDLAFYRARLDDLYGVFGEDRVLYGSDWPNSDQWGSYEKGLAIMRAYFAGKSPEARAKFFWRNSVSAYRWIRRDPGQPHAN